MTASVADAPVIPEETLQQIARKMVQDEVYCNVGAFMDYCIKRAFEGDEDNPITEDDLNFAPDPSNWDDAALNDFLINDLGTTWKEVAGKAYPTPVTDEEIAKVTDYIRENAEADDIAAFDENNSGLGLSEWDAETLNEFVSDVLSEEWQDITGTRPDFLDIDEDETEQARDYIRDNAEAREPLEWWAVSGWLGEQLKKRDEIIIDLGGGTVIWGRQTSGQAIYMDGDIQDIAKVRMQR